MSEVEAPQRLLITIANTIIDFAIKGLGSDAAYVAVVSQAPWLGGPIIGKITKWVLDMIIGKIDERVKLSADVLLVRLGNDLRKSEYDSALKPIQEKENPTNAEIEAAKAAIDHIVHRGD